MSSLERSLTMSQSVKIDFLREDIDEAKLRNISREYKDYSASFTERTIVSKIMPLISPVLPLQEDELRTLFFQVFKFYNGSGHPPLQKLALLEGEERVEPLKFLKNTIVDTFGTVFLQPYKREKAGNKLDRILQRYFQRVCSYFD
jgi:hypothetical protein